MDGLEVIPLPNFQKSYLYKTFLKLKSSNSVYNDFLLDYDNPEHAFDFKLGVDDQKVGSTRYAMTDFEVSKDGPGKSVVVGVIGNSYYLGIPNDAGMEDRATSEIFDVQTLLHEAGHAYLKALNQDDPKAKGDSHENYSSIQRQTFTGLKEYSDENKLGYSDEDLENLSWTGIENSTAFDDMIKDKSTKSGLSMQEEFKKYETHKEKLKYEKAPNQKK
ncbi:MAG: hypothetical protein IPJ60_10455 [Sphingobacteriaceae bacterium]|nr:hypothetical protein [Sphingobacteriaceae bacterium]